MVFVITGKKTYRRIILYVHNADGAFLPYLDLIAVPVKQPYIIKRRGLSRVFSYSAAPKAARVSPVIR